MVTACGGPVQSKSDRWVQPARCSGGRRCLDGLAGLEAHLRHHREHPSLPRGMTTRLVSTFALGLTLLLAAPMRAETSGAAIAAGLAYASGTRWAGAAPG